MGRSCSQNEKNRSDFKILTGMSTGKRPLVRPIRRWEDNIRMDIKEIGINMRNYVDSAEGKDYWRALVNAAQNLLVHRPRSELVVSSKHKSILLLINAF